MFGLDFLLFSLASFALLLTFVIYFWFLGIYFCSEVDDNA